MLKLLVKKIWIWISNLWVSKYKTAWVEDLPKELDKSTIYIVGGKEHPFQAVFLCSRSCGKVISLNISKQHNKWERWIVTEHKNSTISLYPSIWMKTFDCNCHYWFREGRIIWVK